MSLSFQDDGHPDDFWAPLFLAFRDITGQAPIDKVAYPGVYVTPACFSDNIYDGRLFEACFSNLLSAQFRRLILDVHWDVSNRHFTLCPAQLPHLPANATEQAGALEPTGVTGVAVPSSSGTDSVLGRRQGNQTTDTAPSNTTAQRTATTTLSSAISTSTSSAGSQLLQLGPYQCSDDLSLDSLFNILDGWIDSSSDQVRARFITLQFNIHAAASPDDPDGAPRAPAVSELPSSNEVVGRQFDNHDLGGYIYKPSDLAQDRRNLNASWFQVTTLNRLPVTGYYDISKKEDGSLETSNGWPSEGYLLFNRFKRFLLTYGDVAPEMNAYNLRSDERLFSANETARLREADINAEGIVTSGCYYSDSTTEVDRVNNTWAVTAVEQYSSSPQSIIDNLTSCGLAPALNSTLNGTTDTSYRPYQNFTQGTIFGWAPGEPRNAAAKSKADGSDDQFRCVVLDPSDAYRGHWRVANCQEKHRAACRTGGQPFNWRLSSSEELYMDAPAVCPSDSELGMPRTALENTYLYQHILQDSQMQRGKSYRTGIWINLNALDVQDCWVTSGPNGSCTYQSDQDESHSREVLIPTIAALIVLVLTALTILVKCNVKRRNSRVRRMGPGGWEYEGVPS